MRVPSPSPVLDQYVAPVGPEMLCSTGAGVWRKAPGAFPDSSSALDGFQSATQGKRMATSRAAGRRSKRFGNECPVLKVDGPNC